MNDKNTNQRMTPKQAVIIYKDGSKYQSDFYLESREIKNINGKYVFMTPVPLANNVMKEIAGSYMKKNEIMMDWAGLIPEHILFGTKKAGLVSVMWYRPASQRTLNFASELKIKGSVAVQLPALLFLLLNNKLHIYALENSDRPSYKTKIFNAPFFNIYKDGNVCMGTAHVGNKTRYFETEAERYERAFFLADQTGGNEKPCKSPLRKLWPELMKKKTPFPTKKELIQHSRYKTLGDLVNKLIGNKNDNYEEEDDDYEDID